MLSSSNPPMIIRGLTSAAGWVPWSTEAHATFPVSAERLYTKAAASPCLERPVACLKKLFLSPAHHSGALFTFQNGRPISRTNVQRALHRRLGRLASRALKSRFQLIGRWTRDADASGRSMIHGTGLWARMLWSENLSLLTKEVVYIDSLRLGQDTETSLIITSVSKITMRTTTAAAVRNRPHGTSFIAKSSENIDCCLGIFQKQPSYSS